MFGGSPLTVICAVPAIDSGSVKSASTIDCPATTHQPPAGCDGAGSQISIEVSFPLLKLYAAGRRLVDRTTPNVGANGLAAIIALLATFIREPFKSVVGGTTERWAHEIKSIVAKSEQKGSRRFSRTAFSSSSTKTDSGYDYLRRSFSPREPSPFPANFQAGVNGMSTASDSPRAFLYTCATSATGSNRGIASPSR